MGIISKVKPVKLISGFIFRDVQAFTKAKINLCRRFGEIDFESKALAFNLSDYYFKEFGEPLTRKFISFKKLILPQDLARIKIYTNKLERGLSQLGKRTVNIDPGYLDMAKLILASTKDYVHRIYIGGGIFAEITLFFKNETFNSWEWTYPDYKTKDYVKIFNEMRSLYAGQVKKI